MTAEYAFSPHIVAPLVVGVLTGLLGLAVFVREKGSLVSAAFLALTLTGAAWQLSYVGIYSALSEPSALFWIRIENAAVALIPAGITAFTLAVLQKFHRLRWFAWATLATHRLRWFAWATLAISLGFAAAALFSESFIAGTYRYDWGFYARYGWLTVPFLGFFFSVLMASLRLYWLEHRQLTGLKQQRLRAFMTGFMIAYLGSIDFIAAYGVRVYPLGYLPVFAFLVLMARAIWRYRLLDLTPAFAANQILRTMADGLLVLDLEVVIRVVNDSACRLFGKHRNELVGTPLWTISGAFFTKEKMDKLLRSGVIQGYETPFAGPDGQARTLDISASLIRDAEQRPVGIVCIARDVTERKAAEQEVRQAHEELQRSLDELKSAQAQLLRSGKPPRT